MVMRNMMFTEQVINGTFGGIPNAIRHPRRHYSGLFYCHYDNPRFIILDPECWEEFPDFSLVASEVTSFGLDDSVEAVYGRPWFAKLADARNSEYCVLGIILCNDSLNGSRSGHLTPKDFGPYYGDRRATEVVLDRPTNETNNNFYAYSVFRYTGSRYR